MALRVATIPGAPASVADFWRRVHPRPRRGFILGSGAGTPADRFVYFSLEEPRRLIAASPAKARAALRAVERALSDRRDVYPRFVGFLGFDAGRGFDAGLARLPRRPDSSGLPAVELADYAAVARYDAALGRIDVVTRGSSRHAAAARLRVLAALGAAKPPVFAAKPAGRGPVRVAGAPAFGRAVAAAKARIAAGDIYQANLSLLFERPFSGDPVELYGALCRKNPSPYAALLKSGESWIVSNSPELLVEVTGRDAITRPIAGTRPRGRDAGNDRRLRGQLLLSPKERAEHIMLVDLERNDLGRVCAAGTVEVTERFAVEKYSHVMHIVSEVRGRLAPGRRAGDAVAALFPGGTITGCPKISAVTIIEALEGAGRSIFYGSAGYFAGNGDAKFNILIRTALVRRGQLRLRAGAGIVADSRAPKEYRECLAKAGAVLEAAAAVSAAGGRAR